MRSKHGPGSGILPIVLKWVDQPAQHPTSRTSAMKKNSRLTIASLVLLFGAALGYAAPASENWENLCTKCHGDDGKGQTKAGKKLQLKDYSDAKVQAEMKDDDMIKVITEGVTDKAGKEKMKAFKGDLSADEIKDLVAYVRKMKT
jgi:cytochrome c553